MSKPKQPTLDLNDPFEEVVPTRVWRDAEARLDRLERIGRYCRDNPQIRLVRPLTREVVYGGGVAWRTTRGQVSGGSPPEGGE